MNSKNKGNAFERKIANLLSERFAERTGIAKSFRRSVDSGSFFGGKNQARTQTHAVDKATFGDIICPPGFAYSVECKHYKECPSLANVMQQNVRDWDSWISQAEQDSKNSGKAMAIIVKYNRMDEMVILSRPVPGAISLPYKQYALVWLRDFLAMDDDTFFSDQSA